MGVILVGTDREQRSKYGQYRGVLGFVLAIPVIIAFYLMGLIPMTAPYFWMMIFAFIAAITVLVVRFKGKNPEDEGKI